MLHRWEWNEILGLWPSGSLAHLEHATYAVGHSVNLLLSRMRFLELTTQKRCFLCSCRLVPSHQPLPHALVSALVLS